MSNPRYWWYGSVKRAVTMWSKTNNRTQSGYKRIDKAIKRALEDVDKYENADARKRAIYAVLINNTHTIDGAALELHSSHNVVQRWITSFINNVGGYMGFEGEEKQK